MYYVWLRPIIAIATLIDTPGPRRLVLGADHTAHTATEIEMLI